ncbi:MAG: hypothetical protein GEU86_15335 [Actinophytocola sp.]|nr:hypothetical protein [Actinophytocola sp.]
MSRLLRKLVSLGKRPFSPRRESDVEDDPAAARTRESGGEPGHHDDDAAASTGPGESGTFVGRVAGQDAGAGEHTGAEARSDDERQN